MAQSSLHDVGKEPASGRPWIGNLLLACTYLIFGKLALLQAVPPGYATIIFFPSGIALASIVRFGPGLLPGVWVGAFLLNLGMGGKLGAISVFAAVLVGSGTVLQTWVASRLFQRWCAPALARATDVLGFLALAPVACLVNASLSVSGLLALQVVSAESLLSNWIFWWAGDTIGVLVAAPLAWLLIGQPQRLWERRRWLLGIPLALSSAAFILVFVKVSTLEHQQNRHEFTLNAQQLADVFQAQFGEHERLLYALGNLFNQSQVATPESFARVARSYLDNRPELRLISWAPRVTLAQRAAFERHAQGGVAADFVIRQFSAGKQLAPAPEREQYFPTAFVEPLAGNERILGMDMLSEPLRAAMVRNAIERKRPTASEPISLVQKQGERAILLAQMVYPEGRAAQQEPSGMLVTVIDIAPYIQQALAQTGIAGLSVRLEDVTHASHPLPMSDQLHDRSSYSEVKKPLSLGGRNYLLTVRPSDTYVREHQEWQSWGALGVGMALTGLLGAFLMLISGQREQIEALVVERTHDLRESEGRLKAILDQAADAILTVGRDLRLLTANGAAERLFGYQAGRMAGLPFDALLQAREGKPRTALAELANRVHLPSEGAPADDTLGRRSDGAAFPLAMSASLVELPDEAFYVVILHDLSEQRRAQQKILALEAFKQAQNELRTAEKMASLGSLVAGIAHELNTPIGNSLLAATSLSGRVAQFQRALEDGPVRRSALSEHIAESAHACELISGSLHRVADLITSFKQVAVDQTVDQRRDFDLLAVCQASLLTQASAMQAAKCRVHYAIEPGLMLHSHPGSISQVMIALANNAMLHAFNGHGGKIDLAARELPDDMIEIVFKDNGSGMAPEILSRVFDPFFTTKLGQGSSGLGMNIVYNVVTGMLGGRITIESALGQGTSVILVIPRKGAGADEGARNLKQLAAAQREAEARYLATMAP